MLQTAPTTARGDLLRSKRTAPWHFNNGPVCFTQTNGVMSGMMEAAHFIFIQAGLSTAKQWGEEGAKQARHQQKTDPYGWRINGEEWSSIGVYAPEGSSSSEQLPIPAR